MTLTQIQKTAFQKLDGEQLLTAGKLFKHIDAETKNQALSRLDPENLGYALNTWSELDPELCVQMLEELSDENLLNALESPNFCTESELEALRCAAVYGKALSEEYLFNAVNSWFLDSAEESYRKIREDIIPRLNGEWLLRAVLEWFNDEEETANNKDYEDE